MATPEQGKKKQGKLKVKFAGRFRDHVQCRKTSVRITSNPLILKDRIKFYEDTIRDLRNIVEVLEQVDLKEQRPSVGELLASSCPPAESGANPDWPKMTEETRSRYQTWGESFIRVLQDELRLTEDFRHGEAYDCSKQKNDTVRAIQEILERR